MADISMCANHECPSRKKCYRFMAKPDPDLQWFGTFELPIGKQHCEDFWDMTEDDYEDN